MQKRTGWNNFMQIKNLVGKLFQQSKLLGTWWGNLQTIAQHTNIYIQFMILCFSGTSAYAVLATTLHEWGYQLPFWQFVLGVVIVIGIMSIFAWRFSIPSTFATWNQQWWENGNAARPILEQLQKDNDELKKNISEIKKLLEAKNEQKVQ